MMLPSGMPRAATTLADPCTGARRRDFLLGLRHGQLAGAQVPSWCSRHGWTLVAPNELARLASLQLAATRHLEGTGRMPALSGDHAHDVGLLHDQEVLAVDAHFGARPLAEQHPIAGFDVELDDLAAVVPGSRTDGDDFALLRLLLGGVRNDDAAFGLLLRVDAADHDTVVQRTEFHNVPSWL